MFLGLYIHFPVNYLLLTSVSSFSLWTTTIFTEEYVSYYILLVQFNIIVMLLYMYDIIKYYIQ